MSTFDYRIVADGGSRRNGSADSQAYGSFQLTARTGQTDVQRRTFNGTGITNNEAEYLAMVAAFEDLVNRIRKAKADPSKYSVIAYTDSALVINQTTGHWKARKKILADHAARLRTLLALFDKATLAKAPRDKVEAILGH